MNEISREYASALFALAREDGAEEEYAKGLAAISAAFVKTPKYVDFLSSHGIPKEERISALFAVFSGRVPTHVLSFLSLLCEKGRMREFADCVEAYEALLREWKQTSMAEVVSAVELTEGEKAKLLKKLESVCGHAVVAEYRVDESLVGGVSVTVDGKVMDGSLRRRLQEVKEVMADERTT
ncbi:MAG: ATP synthase F1 subunit delta [Clostridia bacterium]|nr:ATP synthase F1 subunit delta [Clostridia bacterium]